MIREHLFCTAIVCVLIASPAMADMTLSVSGKASPYFAGQTFGTIPPAGESYFDTDLLDPETMPPWIDITGFGGTISITATGEWGHPTLSGPDGYAGWDPTHAEYIALGISTVTDAPLNALAGVFLGPAVPVAGSAPTALPYGADMTSPLLQQTFIIGSSLSGINIPTGATRLFFGLNNGYEWTNNVGALSVTVVPVPAAVLLGMLGLGAAGLRLRRFA
ncbi:MAG: hypothetical protein A2Y76_00385 [Planctomycetes bacterium RBG_13_60_9]|nr:MAG: hypothetical protein A2Y76_00385 [Planctomycetes bacterium RBG_13_60_9]